MPYHMAHMMLPVADNEGVSTHVAFGVAQAAMLDAFGGYTESLIHHGVWRDPASGVTYSDNVIRFDIAADWDADGNADKLRGIASVAASDMGQECVFMCLPTGVEFVAPMAAAMVA